jgi:hypothetical protein
MTKSNGSREVERVRQARCILERMRGRLLEPTFQALDSSAADLKLAVECLGQLDISLESPTWQGLALHKIETEVVALRSAVRSVEELLKNAGKFYAGLAGLMAPDEAPANYTAAGTTGARSLGGAGSVVIHG